MTHCVISGKYNTLRHDGQVAIGTAFRDQDCFLAVCYTADILSRIWEQRQGEAAVQLFTLVTTARRRLLSPFALLLVLFLFRSAAAQAEPDLQPHLVMPGETWLALSVRYNLTPDDLRAANPHLNQQRQPTIGAYISIPESHLPQRNGYLLRSGHGRLLWVAAEYGLNPWYLALLNDVQSPYRPLLYRPLFIPDDMSIPLDLPSGFRTLELSPLDPRPGQGLALRALTDGQLSVSALLSDLPVSWFANENYLVGLAGANGFYPAGDHELTIMVANEPLWSQPWRMSPGEWTFQQLTLTGDAAAIDQESIRKERERLFAIWNFETQTPHWTGPFQMPIHDYLAISSDYGARRSYNGGPYQSYHEGVDFSAYGGTDVLAPAKGRVMLAERLYVRGGAVIVDHGLGVYSGFYHLSEVLAEPGQQVNPGDLLGKVGTTGLSTGNHLHWDLLVAGTWVDALSWLENETACFVLEGWGGSCEG